MVEPYTFPFDIVALADPAALAAHLITNTAQLEAWSTRRQHLGGPVPVVTRTQAHGARWATGEYGERPGQIRTCPIRIFGNISHTRPRQTLILCEISGLRIRFRPRSDHNETSTSQGTAIQARYSG